MKVKYSIVIFGVRRVEMLTPLFVWIKFISLATKNNNFNDLFTIYTVSSTTK